MSVTSTDLGGDLHRIDAVIENRGYLPTFVLGSAKNKPWNDPVRATIVTGDGLTLEAGHTTEEVGHLTGWGGNDRSTTPMSAGSTIGFPRRKVSWVVRGRGDVIVRAGAARVGDVEREIHIG